ncbi:MAG: DUF2807 domain-containing protein [Sphingomonas sp.]
MRCLALLLPLLLLAGAARPADERVFMVTGFDRVRVDGPFDVEIRAGLSPRASATGDTRALARLSVRVEGGTLIVGTGSRGWDLKPGEGRGLAQDHAHRGLAPRGADHRRRARPCRGRARGARRSRAQRRGARSMSRESTRRTSTSCSRAPAR